MAIASKKRSGKSRHFAAAEEIGSRILRGDFAPGVLLPNEAEWCKRLRMSRSAVREAIKMLKAKGLLNSRPKVGTRVEPRARWNLLDRDVLAWYMATPERARFLKAVQQMRRIFEPEAAALAAVNRDRRADGCDQRTPAATWGRRRPSRTASKRTCASIWES